MLPYPRAEVLDEVCQLHALGYTRYRLQQGEDPLRAHGKRVARLAPCVLRRVQHVEGGGSISRVTERVQARRGLADFHAGVPAYARQRPSRLRPPRSRRATARFLSRGRRRRRSGGRRSSPTCSRGRFDGGGPLPKTSIKLTDASVPGQPEENPLGTKVRLRLVEGVAL